ncbi:hypothetical protein SCA6_018058 [Theobroma cacao]
MSNISLVEAKLPPGFRFHPRDEELVCDYLMRKVATSTDALQLMIEVDLNKCEPWDIPEITAKPRSMGSCYDDTGSSPLPPLMDSYITFDQSEPNLDEYKQVPCFSTFSPSQTNPFFTNTTYMEPSLPAKTQPALGQIPMNACLDSFPCDQKVIKAVLNHLTKLDSYLNVKESPSFGEGCSESYLSEVGMPDIWNH